MHDLDRLVREWRRQMTQCETMRRDDIDELEEHLRESIKSLAATGLSAEEAFLVAESRLGKPKRLAKEFSKTNNGFVWKQRVFWMVAGHMLAFTVGGLVSAVTSVSQNVSMLGGNLLLASFAGPLATVSIWAVTIWLLYKTAVGHHTFIHWIATKANRFSAVKLIAAVCGVVVVTRVLQIGSNVTITKFITPEDFGRISLMNYYFMLIWTPVFAIGGIAFLVYLRRQLRTGHA